MMKICHALFSDVSPIVQDPVLLGCIESLDKFPGLVAGCRVMAGVREIADVE